MLKIAFFLVFAKIKNFQQQPNICSSTCKLSFIEFLRKRNNPVSQAMLLLQGAFVTNTAYSLWNFTLKV